tara:strand:+ start:409 stop:1032 length:624 start_codon:yes stop_codon:yes gene_type:complete
MKKTILKESTIRRFWKLANVGAINEMGYSFADLNEEEEELEEVAAKDDEEKVDEAKCDDEVAESKHDRDEDKEVDEMSMKPARDDEDKKDEAMYARDDEEEVDEEMDDMGADDDMPMDNAEGGDMDAEVSVDSEDVASLAAAVRVLQDILDAAGGGADEPMDPAGDEDPMMEEDELDEERIDDMVNTIAERVKKRLVKEALINRLKK